MPREKSDLKLTKKINEERVRRHIQVYLKFADKTSELRKRQIQLWAKLRKYIDEKKLKELREKISKL